MHANMPLTTLYVSVSDEDDDDGSGCFQVATWSPGDCYKQV